MHEVTRPTRPMFPAAIEPSRGGSEATGRLGGSGLSRASAEPVRAAPFADPQLHGRAR